MRGNGEHRSARFSFIPFDQYKNKEHALIKENEKEKKESKKSDGTRTFKPLDHARGRRAGVPHERNLIGDAGLAVPRRFSHGWHPQPGADGILRAQLGAELGDAFCRSCLVKGHGVFVAAQSGDDDFCFLVRLVA